MTCHPYSERVARCAGLMKAAGLDVLLLAKPANMAYLTGDGRLCAPAARPRLFPWREGAAAAGDQCGYRRRELRPLTGPWGVRVEDTVVVKPDGPLILTDFVRKLEM